MGDPLFWHRLQFGFTATYHYLFPQLTMGLAFIIVVLKALGLKTGEARYNDAARFWIRIFGINFAVGVVTGIPLDQLTARAGELDRNRPVLVCCETGSRSGLGVSILKRAGFSEVANLGSWRRLQSLLN